MKLWNVSAQANWWESTKLQNSPREATRITQNMFSWHVDLHINDAVFRGIAYQDRVEYFPCNVDVSQSLFSWLVAQHDNAVPSHVLRELSIEKMEAKKRGVCAASAGLQRICHISLDLICVNNLLWHLIYKTCLYSIGGDCIGACVVFLVCHLVKLGRTDVPDS